jgi:hypothetical protein
MLLLMLLCILSEVPHLMICLLTGDSHSKMERKQQKSKKDAPSKAGPKSSLSGKKKKESRSKPSLPGVGKRAPPTDVKASTPQSPGVSTRRGSSLDKKRAEVNRLQNAIFRDKMAEKEMKEEKKASSAQQPQRKEEGGSLTLSVPRKKKDAPTTNIKPSDADSNYFYLDELDPPSKDDIEYAKKWKELQKANAVSSKKALVTGDELLQNQENIGLQKVERSTRVITTTKTEGGPPSSKKSEYPLLKSLSPRALVFIFQVMGRDQLPPKRHMQAELNEFVPLMKAFPKFVTAAGAKARVGESLKFSLQLRYFGGCCIDTDLGKMTNKPKDLFVAKHLTDFITLQFNNRDQPAIERCVNRARTIYITAVREDTSQTKKGKETMVAIINFAVVGNHGIYINWLATSEETILASKYGKQLEFELAGGTWRKRHFALFLLQMAKLSVDSYLYHKGQQLTSFNILLQTLVVATEKAHQFYSHLGFVDCGDISESTSMKHELGDEFASVLVAGEDSKTDYVHFMRDESNMCVFRNQTGEFGDVHHLHRRIRRHYYKDKPLSTNKWLIIFPFKVKREHTLVLASGLHLFYLPFKENVDMDDFLRPTSATSHHKRVSIGKEHYAIMESEEGWLVDSHINFVGKWYVGEWMC